MILAEPTHSRTLHVFYSGSNAGSSSVAPVDGIVDLQEEEMEQSVFGKDSHLMILAHKPNTFIIGLCVQNTNIFFCFNGLLAQKEQNILFIFSVWFTLGLLFALDPSTVPPSLHLSNFSLTITYHGESPPGPPPDNKVSRSMTSDPQPTLAVPQVCADVVIARGQYYWEVDVCNSSVYRIGKNPLEFV